MERTDKIQFFIGNSKRGGKVSWISKWESGRGKNMKCGLLKIWWGELQEMQWNGESKILSSAGGYNAWWKK